jgi:hypothetical protein
MGDWRNGDRTALKVHTSAASAQSARAHLACGLRFRIDLKLKLRAEECNIKFKKKIGLTKN